MPSGPPLLSIVVPALNEEDAIADTIRRCLDARAHIAAQAGLSAVEVLVVSDGSSDRTEEIALGFPDVTVLTFERNRGYGAAIKAAWQESDADLLAFLDADGTCDPNTLVALCNQAVEEQADVVLGCRLNRASRMPLLRRLGNVIFALTLSVFSSQRVRDTSSGMRVVRRSSSCPSSCRCCT